MFERKIYQEMLRWKHDYAPKYALFLKGARRVGKTTLAKKLGEEAYKSHILIRFDQVTDDVRNLFVNGLLDLDTLFETLQLIYKTKLFRGESLIILDEVQLFPAARQALKTLLEDGRYHYLETGSLEVKSGKSLSIKSLERIKATYGSRIGDGIVLHHGEVKEQDGILFLPYYAAAVL